MAEGAEEPRVRAQRGPARCAGESFTPRTCSRPDPGIRLRRDRDRSAVSGKVVWLLLPTVNADLMSSAMSAFAQQACACAERPLAQVLDGAGWHTCHALKVPEHVHLIFLPPYSPELQPTETIWPLYNDAIANRTFNTLDELEVVIGDLCGQLDQQPEQISSHTSFHG
jgi:DDE superfamily endonuclease